MNICMMTNTYLPHVGGVARSVHTFAEEFRRLGHDTLVVAPTFAASQHSPHAAEETNEEWVERLPAIQQFNGSDFSVRLPIAGMFNERIDQFQAHIIHSHHPFLLGDTALRIAAVKHVPVIFTHHTLYEQYTHYVPFDSGTLKQFTIELSTHYANLCDAVIAPSESIAQLIKERGVEAPISVIPTGIDVGRFASGDRQAFRKKFGIPARAFVVGHVGRLAPEKNLRYLAEAVALFLKHSPRSIFLVVGAGPAEAEIQEVFEKRGLLERLVLAGAQTGRHLHNAYAAMDIFAFSSMSETQGLVVAEAMAANLPVVALDASGVREVVKNRKNGFLLASESPPDEFAACLAKLSTAPSLRKALRTGAQETACLFSKEHCAEKALALYESVRTQTRPRRNAEREDVFAALVKRIDVEWGLILEKTKAAVNAFLTEPAAEKVTRDLSV